MSLREELDDLDLDLAGIDDGGNNKPSVYFSEDEHSWIYRASAINSCSKQLQLFREGVEGAPPPPDMLRRFRDGHLHEKAILAEIQKQRPGWKVYPHDPDTGQQVETNLVVKEPDVDRGITGIIIRGHTDGTAINRGMNPDSRICEAKALSDDNFKKFVKLEQSDRTKLWEQYPYYRDSMAVYMASLEVPCFYAVKNKNSGEVYVFDLEEPPGDLDAIISRIRVIDARAARGDIDEHCDRRSYPCPMFRFHTDEDADSPEAIMDQALGTAPATTADGWSDPEQLERLCQEYDEFRASEKESGSRKKETGVKIMEQFLLTGDKVQTANFTVKVKQHTHRYIDKAALGDFLEQHGMSVADFEGETKTEYADVRRRKKK